MIARTTDIALINRIANSDAVRPFIRPDGEMMDFAPLEGKRVGETGVVVLTNGEDAIAVFEITADKIYQAHTMFSDTCRGRRALDTAHEMIDWMFDHNVDVVWGATPRENRKAVMFNRLLGAKLIGGDDEELIFEYRKAA